MTFIPPSVLEGPQLFTTRHRQNYEREILSRINWLAKRRVPLLYVEDNLHDRKECRKHYESYVEILNRHRSGETVRAIRLHLTQHVTAERSRRERFQSGRERIASAGLEHPPGPLRNLARQRVRRQYRLERDKINKLEDREEFVRRALEVAISNQ